MSLTDGEASKRAEEKTHGGHAGSNKKAKAKGGSKKAKKTKASKPAKRVSLADAKKALNPKGKKPNAAERRVNAEDAKATAEDLLRRWDQIQKTEGRLADVGKKAAEGVKAAWASLVEAIETGVDVSSGPSAYHEKCDAIAEAWQHWQEAKVISADERKEAKKARKAAFEAMGKAVEETRQLALKW